MFLSSRTVASVALRETERSQACGVTLTLVMKSSSLICCVYRRCNSGFDQQEMKRYYQRIVAGSAVGLCSLTCRH